MKRFLSTLIFFLNFFNIIPPAKIDRNTSVYDNDDDMKVSPKIVPIASWEPEKEPIWNMAIKNIINSGNDVKSGDTIVPTKLFEKFNLKPMNSIAFTNSKEAKKTRNMLTMRS